MMDFTKRLERIFEYYELTASTFSERINVQRSTISHLLSGRNKPSLDFIMKVVDEFPEVDLFWLVDGKGMFPKNSTTLLYSEKEKEEIDNEETNQINLFENIKEVESEKVKIVISKSENENLIETKIVPSSQNVDYNSDEIESIIVFYKDGSFKKYLSRN